MFPVIITCQRNLHLITTVFPTQLSGWGNQLSDSVNQLSGWGFRQSIIRLGQPIIRLSQSIIRLGQPIIRCRMKLSPCIVG